MLHVCFNDPNKMVGNFDYNQFRRKLQIQMKKKPTGLTMTMKLSPGLAEIVGLGQASRTEIMKRLHWYVKSQDLLDPIDRRYFYPDRKMQPIFGSNRMRTFTMAKFLKDHLTSLDESK